MIRIGLPCAKSSFNRSAQRAACPKDHTKILVHAKSRPAAGTYIFSSLQRAARPKDDTKILAHAKSRPAAGTYFFSNLQRAARWRERCLAFLPGVERDASFGSISARGPLAVRLNDLMAR